VLLAESSPVIGGYVASWRDRKLVERLPLGSYTHLFHAFLTANAEGELITTERLPNKWLPALGHKHGCKVILSLGGGGYHHFPEIVADGVRRKRFVAAVVGVVVDYGYDGVDVDWEHPRTEEQGKHWVSLVKELRSALTAAAASQKRADAFLLTAAVFSNDWGSKWIDVKAVQKELDYVNVMTYDFAGAWGGVVGPHAALVGANDSGLSVTSGMNYWSEKRGIPKSKLVVGLPFYGFLFHDSTLGERLEAGHGRRVKAITWVEVGPLLRQKGWASRHTAAKDALLLENSAASIVGAIDDAPVIKKKTSWALKQEFGGVFVWELGHEIGDGATGTPLTGAIGDAVNAHKARTKERTP
jgi:chitinase